MTIKEAVENKIYRLRRPMWPESAYIKLAPVDEYIGPWAYLYDRQTQSAIGEPTPQTVLVIGAAHEYCNDFEPYTGLLDESDKPVE
jgi:hypothetical protein